MPGKVRVHELAKQLGRPSKDVLATLREQGVVVKSGSSTVAAPIARRLLDGSPTTVAALAAELGVSERDVLDVLPGDLGDDLAADARLRGQLAAHVRQRIQAGEYVHLPAPPEPALPQEPRHDFIAEDGASVVHHRDYLSDHSDHALCGSSVWAIGRRLRSPRFAVGVWRLRVAAT